MASISLLSPLISAKSGRNRERNGGEAVDGGAMMRSGRDDLRLLLIFFPFLQKVLCRNKKYYPLHNDTDL